MSSIEEFRRAVARAAAYAYATVDFRFDSAEDPLCRLDYHCVQHSKGVAARARRILEIVEERAPGTVGQDGVEVGALAGAWHDVEQQWYVVVEDDGCAVRKRAHGRNERLSFEQAAAALTAIDAAREKSGLRPVFGPRHRTLLFDGIMATEPRFGPSGITQPYLEGRASAVAFAVALADLGEVGASVSTFLLTGDQVFREDCFGCSAAVLRQTDLDPGLVAVFRDRMRRHAHAQVRFAVSIRDRMPFYLSGFPAPARAAIAAQYAAFDDSIAAAKERAARRDKMSFGELVADMGYEF